MDNAGYGKKCQELHSFTVPKKLSIHEKSLQDAPDSLTPGGSKETTMGF